MRYKATLAVGFAAGYVLGSKAGRERYESILRAARGFADNPSVQETAGVLQAQAGNLLQSARRLVGDRAGAAATSVTERMKDRVPTLGNGGGGPGESKRTESKRTESRRMRHAGAPETPPAPYPGAPAPEATGGPSPNGDPGPGRLPG